MDVVDTGSVRAMAAHVGLSERQFRRVMRDQLGLSPKQLHRVVRLQQSLREVLDAAGTPWTAGFYDDSHRIRELKALTGLTPGQIQRMAEIYNQRQSR